jgi:hypothetical protein
MARRFLAAVTCAVLVPVAAAQSPAPPASPAPPPAASVAPPATSSPSPVPAPYTPAPPDPKRGAELLKKAVAGHGGAKAIDAIQRLELQGFSSRLKAGQDPVEMPSHTHMAGPGLYRHELTTQAGPIATLLNREGAYVLLSGGALPLPDAEAAALRATANRNLTVLLRTRDPKEHTVARVGSARLADGEVEMVEVETAGQKTVLAIDPRTGLVRQSIYMMPIAGATAQVVATYSDYRPLSNGVKYPFKSEGTVDGQPTFTSRLDKVLVNGVIDESLFVLPVSAPTEPLPWASPSPTGD